MYLVPVAHLVRCASYSFCIASIASYSYIVFRVFFVSSLWALIVYQDAIKFGVGKFFTAAGRAASDSVSRVTGSGGSDAGFQNIAGSGSNQPSSKTALKQSYQSYSDNNAV